MLTANSLQISAFEQLVKRFPQQRQQALRLEIQELLSSVLNCSREKLITNSKRKLTDKEIELFNSFIKRRLNDEPLAYILNSQEFYSLNFYVDKNVLIPRPETEILVEQAISILKTNENYQSGAEVVDIGSGSGAIILSVANSFKNSRASNLNFTALDLSDEACKITKKNTDHLNLEINIIQSNLLENYRIKAMPTLFLSNPPYIADSEVLMNSVQAYEPSLALRGGPVGLEIVFRIIELFATSLKLNENNILLLEIGINQDSDVVSFAQKLNLEVLDVYKDLQGINRIVKLGH